jgi:polysaccharide export outer membrane protein
MLMRRFFRFLLIALVCTVAMGARAQVDQPEYVLGPGDNIRVVVFQNPELTLETRVTENGTITYPLVGTLRVGGLTIPAAQQVISRALQSGNYVNQAQVNILLLQNRGNQVSVLGAVQRPGRFPLETFNTRVSEILAMAGGIAPNGADVVILTGTRDGKPLRREIDIAALFLGSKLAEDILVAGGDVLYVQRQPVFYIYGLVQRPGSYRVERGMTIRQALAQGGGPTERGTERGLLVYRRAGDGKLTTESPELSEDVRPDDVLYIRESVF